MRPYLAHTENASAAADCATRSALVLHVPVPAHLFLPVLGDARWGARTRVRCCRSSPRADHRRAGQRPLRRGPDPRPCRSGRKTSCAASRSRPPGREAHPASLRWLRGWRRTSRWSSSSSRWRTSISTCPLPPRTLATWWRFPAVGLLAFRGIGLLIASVVNSAAGGAGRRAGRLPADALSLRGDDPAGDFCRPGCAR